MAEKCGFFNALEDGGEYDRTYNADDYSDNLSAFISNGVRRSGDDDLRITASGLTISMAVGRAWIEGHYYYNDTAKNIAVVTPPSGSFSRIDAVIIQMDENTTARTIKAVYKRGTPSAFPIAPACVRSGGIYELKLAEITVPPGASNVTVKDTRANKSVCGWVTSPIGYDEYFVSLEGAFNEWFDAMKGQLSEDAAGNLQNQIITLASYVANMQNTELYSWNRDADDQDSTQKEIVLSASALGFNELEIHTGEYRDDSACNVLVLTVPKTIEELQEMEVNTTYSTIFNGGGTVGMVEHSAEADFIFSAENKLKLARAPVYAIYNETATVTSGKVKVMEYAYTGGPAFYDLRIKKIIGRGNRNAPIIPIKAEFGGVLQSSNITNRAQSIVREVTQ
jgi:hypothetical protein